ncbi:hypothetical protein [Paenibacillus periandrae]|uniref:hypothetical protein n=1 Tax=Paenibacillus periandrae TaxID=1761741 RepID=UPI001F09B864|nr:hypothetical protein [Paenibacillus periandrae]
MIEKRISAKKKARELAKYVRAERPDYAYLISLRIELEIKVQNHQRCPSLISIKLVYKDCHYCQIGQWNPKDFGEIFR